MKKIILIVLALIWLSSLIVLIISLTDVIENNPFKNYKLILGLTFIVLTGILRKNLLNK